MPALIKPGDKVRHKKYKYWTGNVIEVKRERAGNFSNWWCWLNWRRLLAKKFPWNSYDWAKVDIGNETKLIDLLERWEIVTDVEADGI